MSFGPMSRGLIGAFFLFICGMGTGAQRCQWYDQSWIHSHVSLNLPESSLDFVGMQIEKATVDAVQFHTHDLSLIHAVNRKGLRDKLGFKLVSTINHAGVWYPHYADSDRYVYRINADGTFAGRWSRKHLCFNTPVIEEEIIPEKYVGIPEKIRPEQVWIDEAIITVNVCYCENCLKKYKARYGQEPPRTLTDENWDTWVQWVGFHRDCFEEWMQKVADGVHSVDPDILVTFNHSYFVEQPEAPPAFVKNLSGDIHKDSLELGLYARYGSSSGLEFDLMPGLGSDIWAGIEPKSQEQIYNDISIIVAHGGIWNIGEYPTDFLSLRKEKKYQGPGYRRADIYFDLAAKGAAFARERQKFCQHKNNVRFAAMLHSAKTHYSHVIVNTNTINDEEFGKTSDGTITRNTFGRINSRVYWPNNNPIVSDLIGAYQSLVENHIQFDIIREDQLQTNLDDYELLILAEQTYLEDATVRKIEEFVRNGGAVLATGSTIRAGLEKVFGLARLSNTPAKGGVIDIGGEEVIFDRRWQVRPDGAREILTGAGGTVYESRYGKGGAIYLSCDFFREYARRSGYAHRPVRNGRTLSRYVGALYQRLLGDDPRLKFDGPPWFEFILREDDRAFYLNLINRSMNWKQQKDGGKGLTFRMALPDGPSSVVLQPGGESMEFIYNPGMLELEVDPADVEFHRVVVIDWK